MTNAKPRDIYLAACAAIAEPFAVDGFRYAKSLPGMRRKVGKLTDEVSFQSSSLNSATHVALLVHVYARSPIMQEFRTERASPFHGGNVIGGDQLGNMSPQRAWLKHELAVDAPGLVIETVIGQLRAVAMPFFALMRNLDALVAELLVRDVPGIAPSGLCAVSRAVEYLLASERRDDAQRVFTAWCQRHPEILGAPPGSGFAKEVASLVTHYALNTQSN